MLNGSSASLEDLDLTASKPDPGQPCLSSERVNECTAHDEQAPGQTVRRSNGRTAHGQRAAERVQGTESSGAMGCAAVPSGVHTSHASHAVVAVVASSSHALLNLGACAALG